MAYFPWESIMVIDGNIYTGDRFNGYELEMLEAANIGTTDAEIAEIILSLYSYGDIKRKFIGVRTMEKLIGMFGADKILEIYNKIKESSGDI